MTQLERVLLNDEGDYTAKDGDKVFWFRCLSCNEYVISKIEFKMANVVCPHCKNKFKIRHYKNGHVSIAVRDK